MDNYRRGRQFNDPSSFSSSLPVLSSRSSLIMKDLLDLDGPSKLNSDTRYSLTGNHGVMRSPMLPSNTYMGKGYSTYKAPLQHSGLNTEFTNDRHLRDGRSINERFTGNLSARNISGPGNSRNISSHGNSRNISSNGNSRNFKGDHSRYHTHEDLGSISGFAEELYASGVISAGRMGVNARHRNEVDFEESKERFGGDSSISNYAGDLHTLDFPADSERLQSHVRQERLKRFGGDSVSDFAEDLFTSGFTGNSPGGLQSDLRHGKELDVEDARLKLKRLRGARNNSRHSDKVYESVVNSDLERLHSNGRHGNESNLPSLGNVSGISTGRSDMSRVIENDLEAPRSKVLKSHKNVDSFKESYQYKPSSSATPLDSVSVADFHLLEIIRKVQKAATTSGRKTIVAEKSKPFQAANATVSEEALDSFWKNVSHRLHEDQSKCRSGLNEILQLPEISKGLGVTECLDRDQLKYKPDYREILQSSKMSSLLYENDKRGHNSYAEELGHSSARDINEPLQNYPPYIEEYQGDWCGTVKQRLGVPSQKPAAPVKRGERTISLSPPRKEIWRISQPRKEIWRVSSPKKEILRKSPPRKETWRISSGVSQRHLGGSLRSRSPSLPRYRSPRRLRSRSPRRVRSRSPRRLRSRSPRRLRSRSPRRLRSRSPRRFKSRSPSLRSRSPRRLRGNRSRSPRRISRSPGRLRSRSPDFYSSRLPMRSSHDPSYSDRRSSRSLATVHSRTREKSPIISTPYQLVGALRLVKTAIISTGTSYMLEVSQGGVTEDIFGMPRTLKSTMLLKGFKLKFTALPFGRSNNNCKEGLVSLLEFAIENRYNHDVYVEARAHDDEMDIRDAKPYELAEYFRNTNVVIDFVSRDPLNDSKYKLKATHLKVPGNTDYKPRAGGVLHRLGKKSVLSRLGKQTNIKQRVSCEKEADVEEIYQDDIVAEEFDQEADVEEIDQDDMVAEGFNPEADVEEIYQDDIVAEEFDPEADVEEIYQDDIAAEEFDLEYDDGPLPVSFPSSMSKRLSRPLLQL